MQHPAIQPISFSSSFKCFLVILQALSLSLPKSPSFLVTLQALSLSLFLAKVTKPLTQQNCKSHIQHNSVCCSSVVVTYFSHACHYCQEPYRLYLPNLSYSNGSQCIHKYFNLAVSCGICLRYAHASHKSASAFRFPNL